MLIVKLDKEYSLIIKNFDEGDFINRTIFLNDLLEKYKNTKYYESIDVNYNKYY